MKKFIVLILALNLYLGVSAQFTPGDTLKYRISLKDKAATDYSLQKPEKYLSKKSIERRKKQGLPIDSTDLPVCRTYVDAIRKTGVHVLVTGKWDNFVTVSCNDSTLISEIAQLPFVRSTERVWKGITQRAFQRDSLINKPLRTDSLYGPAITQAAMSRVDLLHDAGFKGQGMTIAVIDAGFHNVDKIDAMKNIRILGVRDFVNPDVVAVGLNSDVMGTDGNLRRANGTSFASPIMCGMVACLWQACPKLTAKQIIDLVRQSGDRADFPDNIYGYGIPDLWKAYQSTQR